MKKPRIDIVNLVGISLVVVALVAAGGLYYTASSYANISETFASVDVSITDVQAYLDNDTGQVRITSLFLVNNPSDLDIQIYRIEYMMYADEDTSSIMEYDRYVGSGSLGNVNNTVEADSLRDVQLTSFINPDTPYMDRFESANQGGTPYLLINGIVWYNIAQFPDAEMKLDGVIFLGPVMLNG